MNDKVTVKNLYKVFGDNPHEAVRLARDKVPKEEIFARTGSTVGVYDASFSIRQSEIFVVMGLSGSGKSTLVRLLNRLIEPTAGEILVDGENVAALSDKDLMLLRRRKMSMVFQSFALMPHLNVLDNASFGLELSGVDRAERHKRAQAALEQVGLKPYGRSYPDELSGGMQQRVGLARALTNDPDILLMDEAFSALDPLIRTEMQDELLKLQENSQRTVVFISHDLDEAMRIGDRIAIMEGGRVVQVGTPEDILKNPADDYVSSFFRGVNVATVLSAGDIAAKKQSTVINREGVGLHAAVQVLKENDRPVGYVVDKGQRYHGVVTVDTLEHALAAGRENLSDAYLTGLDAVPANTHLSQLITTVANAPYGVPVVDAEGRYLGVVSKTRLLQTLSREEN